MEKTEKFRMRWYSKKTATNIYAAPMRGVKDCFCPGNGDNVCRVKGKCRKWVIFAFDFNAFSNIIEEVEYLALTGVSFVYLSYNIA